MRGQLRALGAAWPIQLPTLAQPVPAAERRTRHKKSFLGQLGPVPLPRLPAHGPVARPRPRKHNARQGLLAVVRDAAPPPHKIEKDATRASRYQPGRCAVHQVMFNNRVSAHPFGPHRALCSHQHPLFYIARLVALLGPFWGCLARHGIRRRVVKSWKQKRKSPYKIFLVLPRIAGKTLFVEPLPGFWVWGGADPG